MAGIPPRSRVASKCVPAMDQECQVMDRHEGHPPRCAGEPGQLASPRNASSLPPLTVVLTDLTIPDSKFAALRREYVVAANRITAA